MAGDRDKLPTRSSDADIDGFLEKVRQSPRANAGSGVGRLIFAMDATASREPTWDTASHIQAEMFSEAAAIGRLLVQLVYYRGFRELHATPFTDDAAVMVRQMTAVRCLGGRTQISRVLAHAVRETERQKVNALVFVGDAFEEDIDAVCHRAGEMGLHGVPAFVFQEGNDVIVARAFKQIAQLSGGAYCQFNMASARILKELLAAVAIYAVGGHRALQDFHKRAGRTVLQIAARPRR